MHGGPEEEQRVPGQCCQQQVNHDVRDTLRVMSQNGWTNAQLRENVAAWLIACRRLQLNQPVVTQELLSNVKSGVLCCRLHPNGKTLAASWNGDTSICLFNTTNQQVVSVPNCHASSINDLAWSPDGTKLASIAAGSLNVWKCTGNRLEQVQTNALKYNTNKVSWSPDGAIVAVTCSARKIKLYDQYGGKIKTINMPESEVTNWAQSCNYNYVVGHGYCMTWRSDNVLTVGLENGVILLFDRDGNHIKDLVTKDYKSCVISMNWSPDCSLLAVALLDGRLQLFNQGGELIRENKNYDAYYKGIAKVAWNHDGTLLASLSVGGDRCIWNRCGSKIDVIEDKMNFKTACLDHCVNKSFTFCKNRIEGFDGMGSGLFQTIFPQDLSWKDENTLQIVHFSSFGANLLSVHIPARQVLDAFNQLTLSQLILVDHIYKSAVRLQRLRLVNGRYCQLYNSLPAVIKETVTPYVEIGNQQKKDKCSIQ